MPTFTYKVRNDKGKAAQGKMNADTQADAVDQLHKLGYAVISVKSVSPLLAVNLEQFFTVSKIKTEEYVMFAAQLAAMLDSGVTLTTALDILVEQTENSRLKTATQKVSDDVKAGASFAEALRKHPKVFSNLFVNMAVAGETSGNLEEVLNRLSVFLERQAEFQQKVATALFYPLILIVFSVAVVIFIVLTILPAFVKMFKNAGVPLPLPTQILYNANLFIRGQWVFIIVFLIGMYFFLKYAKASKMGGKFFDKMVLDMPIWGSMARKVEVARFARTLASLLNSGVPMLQALDTLEKTTDNSVYNEVIRDAYDTVRKGGTLSEQLKESGEFPPMAVKMTAVGEESGSLDKMLAKVADFYEMTVDYAIKRVTALLEPLFLVIVGAIVGFILASVILPIFQMVTTLRK
ncbi:MAG: type II secretion system F family protein [Candidatus Margulisiibacteriota bacterium]